MLSLVYAIAMQFYKAWHCENLQSSIANEPSIVKQEAGSSRDAVYLIKSSVEGNSKRRSDARATKKSIEPFLLAANFIM